MSELWVAMDFETATQNPNSACAVGFALIDGGKIIESADILIRPPDNKYSQVCIGVHGILPKDTRDMPSFPEVYPDIQELLSGANVLAHNASFDMRVLRSTIGFYGLEPLELDYVCTVSLSRKAFPHLSSHSLKAMTEHCGIKMVKHHDALSDTFACAEIAIACMDKVKCQNISDAVRTLGVNQKQL